MAYAPCRIVLAWEKAVGEPWVNGLRGRTMRSLLQEKDVDRMYEMIDLLCDIPLALACGLEALG